MRQHAIRKPVVPECSAWQIKLRYVVPPAIFPQPYMHSSLGGVGPVTSEFSDAGMYRYNRSFPAR